MIRNCFSFVGILIFVSESSITRVGFESIRLAIIPRTPLDRLLILAAVYLAKRDDFGARVIMLGDGCVGMQQQKGH